MINAHPLDDLRAHIPSGVPNGGGREVEEERPSALDILQGDLDGAAGIETPQRATPKYWNPSEQPPAVMTARYGMPALTELEALQQVYHSQRVPSPKQLEESAEETVKRHVSGVDKLAVFDKEEGGGVAVTTASRRD